MFYENFNLINNNTFGIEAHCRYYFSYTTTEELRNFLSTFDTSNKNKLTLGYGSNMLFVNDFDGLVLHSEIGYIKEISQSNDTIFVEAGAGMIMDEVIHWAVDRGYGGIENLSLIPGLVGATPVQNIGAYGVEIKDVIHQVDGIDLATGENISFTNRECGFGYRDSIFKRAPYQSIVITSVVFALRKIPVFNISYGDVSVVVESLGGVSVQNIRKAIVSIRESKLPDFKKTGNAGSFFKNPVIYTDLFESIQKKYPGIPSYKSGKEMVKIPAAWLIEQCGLKGYSMQHAAIHDKQPLVLINRGGATGQEILDLANHVIDEVKKTFGIELQPEVILI